MQKLRSDSVLSKLTEDQLADLLDWCGDLSYEDVIKKAAQPAPEGFGLKINKTTLTRFVAQQNKRRHAENLAELAAQSDVSMANSGFSSFNPQPSSLAALIRAARGEFAHATYELSLAAEKPDNYDRLERALHHIDIVAIKREQLELQKQELVLAEKRFALDRESFEYNGARIAMENFLKLQEIHRLPDIDQDHKIQKARGVCFGRVPLDPNTPPSPDEPTLPILPSLANTLIHTTQKSPVGSEPVAATPSPALFSQPETQPSSFNPQPSNPDTLGHTAKKSPVAAEVSPSQPDNSSLIPQPSNPDTLGHTAQESAIAPDASSSQSENSSLNLPPSSLVEASSAPEPRKLPIREWFDIAGELRDSVYQHILTTTLKGNVDRMNHVIKINQHVWIEDPALLRLLPAKA